jgi:peroxiredoxin
MMIVQQAAKSLFTRTAAVQRFGMRYFASVGDKVPSVELDMGFPPKKYNLADFAKDKKIILLGLPGAFTPTWSTKQIPNYLENQDALREKCGIDSVIVYFVNDAAVMQAWAKDQKIGLSMLKLMGDPTGTLTKALDMEMTHPGPVSKGLLGRCKRHAIYAENGIIKVVHIAEKEGDPAGDADPTVTLAEAMMEAIQKA